MYDVNDTECSTSNMGSDYAAGKIKRRRFSSARVQPTRIKKVMQSDEEIGRMVASVPVAIGSAMEHFAERLLETAAQCVQFSNCRTLSPMHIRYAVMTQPHLAFLESLMKDIPLPKFSSDYLESQSHMLSSQMRSSLLDTSLPIASTPNSGITAAFPNSPIFYMPNYGHLNLPSTAVASPIDLKPNYPMLNPPKANEATGNGDEPPKRKRGRPRKIDKDRFIEEKPDMSLLYQQIPLQAFQNGNHQQPKLEEKIDPDRLLMPPPAILPIKSPRQSSDGQSPGVMLKPISLLTNTNGNGTQNNVNGEAIL